MTAVIPDNLETPGPIVRPAGALGGGALSPKIGRRRSFSRENLSLTQLQYWRAMRMYARIARLRDEGERLYAKANRLMGRNVQPPMPLFDNNREGR